MSNRPTHKVEMAFGVGALGDTASATTSGSTDTGNTITCPDAAPLRATTLLDIRMKLSLSDWTPSSPQIIVQKDGGTNNRGWTIQAIAGGMTLSWADTAHTNSLANSHILLIPPFVDGTAHWLRFKIVYQSGDFAGTAITGMWIFVYTSVNGNAWTQYGGSSLVGGSQGGGGPAFNPSTGDLVLRSSDHTQGTVTFYAFEMFTDQDATKSVARLDLDARWAPTDTTWTSRRSNVWTSAAGITLASQWTDVTADWRGPATVSPMGRASLLDTFNAGTASFMLDNADRKYDRSNAAGPHFGQLVSRVPVRWRSQYAGTPYNLFRGVVTGGWGQSYDPGNHDATVSVTASDASVIMSDAPTPDAALDMLMLTGQSEVGGLAGWWKLDSPLVFRDRSAHGLDLTASGAPADAEPLVFGSSDKARLMVDNCYAQRVASPITGYPFTVEFWFQTTAVAVFDGSVTNSVIPFTVTTSDGALLAQVSVGNFGPRVIAPSFTAVPAAGADTFSQCRILDGLPHHVAVVVTSSTATIYIDGAAFAGTVTITGTPGSIATATKVVVGTSSGALSATVDSVAVWTRSLGTGEIADHANVGRHGRGVESAADRALFILEGANWPGHMTDIDGQATTRCQTYEGGDSKALDYLRVVEQTERGELFIDGSGHMRLRRVAANFADTRSVTAQHAWAETDYVAAGFGIQNDDDRIVNQSDVTRDGGAKSTAADQTSIDRFGPRSFSVSEALNTNDIETQAAAGWYVWLGKDQGDRIDNLPIMPDDQPDLLWPLVLDARIGDLQTVTRTPQGVGLPITITAHVEGVSYTLAPDYGGSTASYALSNQQARSGQVLTWGTWAWVDGKVWGP